MSLETLIIELQKIHDVHPNASVEIHVPESRLKDEPRSVRYDNLSKTAVIEL